MSESVTIGISIGIPEPLSSQITRVRRESGDPLAETVVPHITLLPPTPLDKSLLVAALDHVYALCSRTVPFWVRLCGTETFRPCTPVVYLPLREGARRCARLAAAVRSGALDVALSYPYHPHVTVAHNVDDLALDQAASRLAGVDFGFVAERVRFDLQRADGSWSPHAAFELTGVDASERATRRRRRSARQRR